MGKGQESSETMRIDIHPDFLTESLERKRSEFHDEQANVSEPIVVRVEGEHRSPDYESLLQSIYDAVLVTDQDGMIIDHNSRAVDFFLCDADELLRMNVIDIISGASTELLESIKQNLMGQRYTLVEAHCIRRDGSLFASEIAVNNMFMDGVVRLCFFVRDITVRKRTQDALEEAVARLSEHDRARSQFVSNVSHELRTPLTSMIYAVSNMLRGVVGDVPDRIRDYLKLLDSDCKRLLGTVNDILDLRKIENKTLTLARTRIPFARLVTRNVESFRVQADRKEIALTIVVSDEKRWFVDCDPHKMDRVVVNIVGNAVKFTQDGGAIEVSIFRDPAQKDHVVIDVTDTGIGIPTNAVDMVTNRYFTVGDQPSGSGLGLAICKEIVEMHGGSIEVNSPPPGKENGTVVRVCMPIVEAPTLLIADDEEGIVKLLARQVEALGYRVISVRDGLETLEAVKREKPDLVLLDMVLPEMEGTEVILKMKSDKEMMRTPIIVITAAHVGPAKAEILRSFGIPALPKPWNEVDLLDAVEGAFLGATSLSRTDEN